jgi:predicted CopG family antitoxin
MGKAIKISDKVAKELDKLRHAGQSYDGVLIELLAKHTLAEKATNTLMAACGTFLAIINSKTLDGKMFGIQSRIDEIEKVLYNR